MNDARISQLNLAKTLSGDEFVPIAQRSQFTGELTTVYTTPSAIKDYILGMQADAFVPTGSITAYACPVSANDGDAPFGWLLCDGRQVSCTQYAKLFSKIGTTYGGDGVDSFSLPDLRGRSIAGYCSIDDTTDFLDVSGGNWQGGIVSLGSVGGKFQHKLAGSEIPAAAINIEIPSLAPKVVTTTSNTTSTSTSVQNVIQTIYWSASIDGSDFFTWQGDTLTIKHRNWKGPSATTVKYKTYAEGGKIINEGTYKTPKSVGSFKLPFTVLATTDVSITQKSGRSQITLTETPSDSNKYRTTVLFNDDGPRSVGGYSCTLTLKKSETVTNTTTTPVIIKSEIPVPATTITVKTSATNNTPFNVSQPYLTTNYIIKY
jgi:microcystin-dependent protein